MGTHSAIVACCIYSFTLIQCEIQQTESLPVLQLLSGARISPLVQYSAGEVRFYVLCVGHQRRAACKRKSGGSLTSNCICVEEMCPIAPDSASFKSRAISGVYLRCISKQEGLITLTSTRTDTVRVRSLYRNRCSQLQQKTAGIIPHACNKLRTLLLFVLNCFSNETLRSSPRLSDRRFNHLVSDSNKTK